MSSDKEKDSRETKGIRAALIVEVMGRPPEHLTETLNKIIESIDNEKGVQVISKKLNEPTPTKERKDFFTTFAEVEVEVDEVLYLAILMFKYMPAHVEVIEPELIALTNHGWTDILSELTRRLHGYDEVARLLQYQNGVMKKKLQEMGVKVDVINNNPDESEKKDKK